MFTYRLDFGGVIDPRESRFKNLSCLRCFTDEFWTSKGHEMHFFFGCCSIKLMMSFSQFYCRICRNVVLCMVKGTSID